MDLLRRSHERQGKRYLFRFRHGPSWFVLSQNKSVIYCAPRDSPGASRRQPLPTFNFHRARFRRAGGLVFYQVLANRLWSILSQRLLAGQVSRVL
jgi:hypothetical protein